MFGVGAVALFAWLVMSLWNWLLPAIAGFSAITFWQALGLLVLCKLLFGGFFRRRYYGWGWRHRMRAKWAGMTEEEREKFRHGMHRCCGWKAHRQEATPEG
ncbi:MAG: hypothetical protein COA57_04425 [Flavobacteriales bacterium]|nr:MAG: hypothetical protein COA57_04425 [Flavobacteriales bacterium]